MFRHLQIVVLMSLLGATGCERAQDDAAANPPSATPVAPPTLDRQALSPQEVVQKLHECRLSGQYDDLQELVCVEQRTAIVELVLSVDELVAAESALSRMIHERVGEGSAVRFERRAQVANILGPLSRDVEVMSQHINGDRATVEIQVAGRVPLEQVELRREEQSWLVWPDKPIPGLADELRNLADATRRVRTMLQRREMEAEDVFKELAKRQQPALQRIARLTAQSARKDETP